MVHAAATTVLFLVSLAANSPVHGLSTRGYGIILLIAVVSGMFGHTVYNWSLKYIQASVASVSLLGEPIGSSPLAFLLPWIKQTPSIYTIIGGGIILCDIYLTTRLEEKQR